MAFNSLSLSVLFCEIKVRPLIANDDFAHHKGLLRAHRMAGDPWGITDGLANHTEAEVMGLRECK